MSTTRQIEKDLVEREETKTAVSMRKKEERDLNSKIYISLFNVLDNTQLDQEISVLASTVKMMVRRGKGRLE